MSLDALRISANTASTKQCVKLPITSAKQGTTIFAVGQDRAFSQVEFLHLTSSSITKLRPHYSEAYEAMLASEEVLRREWEGPEEDAAWAHL